MGCIIIQFVYVQFFSQKMKLLLNSYNINTLSPICILKMVGTWLKSPAGTYFLAAWYVGIGMETARYIIKYPHASLPYSAVTYPISLPLSMIAVPLEGTRVGLVANTLLKNMAPALV